MEKNCKTQLWDEKQNRVLFLDHTVYCQINQEIMKALKNNNTFEKLSNVSTVFTSCFICDLCSKDFISYL